MGKRLDLNGNNIKVIKVSNLELEIHFTYYYDPGVWTYFNGDPGYPEFAEINIEKVSIQPQGIDITNLVMEHDSLFEAVLDKL